MSPTVVFTPEKYILSISTEFYGGDMICMYPPSPKTDFNSPGAKFLSPGFPRREHHRCTNFYGRDDICVPAPGLL